jgi:cold shock CspA family protein
MATGKIKEVRKNFAFITDDKTGEDAIVHYSVLKTGRFAWEDMVEGAAVSYETEKTVKGLRASKIHTLGAKKAREPLHKIVEPIMKPRLAADQSIEGTLKFFSAEKNYGFVSVEGFQDLFVHIDDVQSHSVRKELEKGRVPKGTRFSLLTKSHTLPARLNRPKVDGVVGIILGFQDDTPAAVSKSVSATKDTSDEEPQSSIADVAFIRNHPQLATTASAK